MSKGRYDIWSTLDEPKGSTNSLVDAVKQATAIECEVFDSELNVDVYHIVNGHYEWNAEWLNQTIGNKVK